MKTKLTKILSLLLILFLVISQNVTVVNAVDGDASTGSGSGSNAGSATNNTIESSTAYKNVLGYRFCCIDENTGDLIEGTKIIDIYNSNWIVSSSKPISTWKVTSGRYNKIQLIKCFDDLSEDDLLTAGTSDWISVNDIGFASSLPQPNGSKVKTWIEYSNYDNVKVVANYCGLAMKNFTSSTIITMEPLIQCNVNDARKAWTPSELAAYGAIQYGLTSRGGSSKSGTFGYNLSRYVCLEFPNLLYVTNDHGAYLSAATELKSKTTYGDVLNGGYGIGVITGDDVGVAVPRLKVSYNANGGALDSSSAYTLGANADGNGEETVCENGLIYYQEWIYNVPNEGGLINDTEFGMYREGYKFVGWAKSKLAVTAYILNPNTTSILDPDNEDILPTDLFPDLENGSGEITLYAIWIPTYTVTFKFPGGTYDPGRASYTNEYIIQNVPYGTQISLITVEREGYVLSYWERTIPESTSKYGPESEYKVTTNTTFVAHWAIEPSDGDTCNILFDINHDGMPINLFACKSANTQNGITSTLNVEKNIVEINGTASEITETLYYFNPLLGAGDYLSGATNLRVVVTNTGGSYIGNVYLCVQAKSGSESYKKHNLLLPTSGTSVLDISLSDDGITNPENVDSLVYSLVVDNGTSSGDWGEWDSDYITFKNYDMDIKIIAVSGSTSEYDNKVLPIGQMVTKSTVWSGNTMNVSRDGYDFGGWSTNKSTYSEYNKSSIVSSDVILYAIWTEKQADVINVRFDENYRNVTPNLYTVDTSTGQLWNESSYTVKDNGIPKEMKYLWTQYKQDSLHGVRLEVYPYQNRIRMSGTLTEGTLTVPLSTMNITFHDTDWFYLFIAPQGTYALDSNFSEATFYLDVYDESGTKVTSLSASSDLLKLNRSNPNACLIIIYQVLDYLDGKSSARCAKQNFHSCTNEELISNAINT